MLAMQHNIIMLYCRPLAVFSVRGRQAWVYSNYDGLGLAELVKKKEVKPAELVEAAFERIERHNPQLNAVVFKAFDEASTMAGIS